MACDVFTGHSTQGIEHATLMMCILQSEQRDVSFTCFEMMLSLALLADFEEVNFLEFYGQKHLKEIQQN